MRPAASGYGASTPGPADFPPSPVLDQGKVFVDSPNGFVFALDAASGELFQQYATSGFQVANIAVSEGVLFVLSQDLNLYAFDVESAQLLWSRRGSVWMFFSLAVAEVVLYVPPSSNDHIHALDPVTGELLWIYPIELGMTSTQSVVDGVVYVSSLDGYLYALDAASGELLWQYEIGAIGFSAPTAADGVVYVGTVEGDLYALKVPQPSAEQSSTEQPEQERKVETTSPEILWQFETIGFVSSRLKEVDGVLYFGSAKADGLDLNEGLLHTLDASSGELLWRNDIGRFGLVPAIVSNGVVYAASLEKKVLAFKLPP